MQRTITARENLQDRFLNRARRERQLVTFFLVNGFQLHGVITGFDSFVVTLNSDGRQQMIYKHAISTLVPSREISLDEDYEKEE